MRRCLTMSPSLLTQGDIACAWQLAIMRVTELVYGFPYGYQLVKAIRASRPVTAKVPAKGDFLIVIVKAAADAIATVIIIVLRQLNQEIEHAPPYNSHISVCQATHSMCCVMRS